MFAMTLGALDNGHAASSSPDVRIEVWFSSATASSRNPLGAGGPSCTWHRIASPSMHNRQQTMSDDARCHCRPCRWSTATQAKLSPVVDQPPAAVRFLGQPMGCCAQSAPVLEPTKRLGRWSLSTCEQRLPSVCVTDCIHVQKASRWANIMPRISTSTPLAT